MGLFSDIISSISNGWHDVFGGGGGGNNDDQRKRQQQQQNTPAPQLNNGPVRLPAVFQAAQQQQQQQNPTLHLTPINPPQQQQQQPQNPAPNAPTINTTSYAQPAQHESLWGHLLHGAGGVVKSVAQPFVNVGEDVSNGIGNAEVGAAHALGLAKDVKTQSNQQQFGDINNAVGLNTEANTPKNFLLNTAQVAGTVLAPGADAAAEAGAHAVLNPEAANTAIQLARMGLHQASNDALNAGLRQAVINTGARVGANAVIGGGFNAANGIEQGENPGQVAKDFGTGALFGGGLGAASGVVPIIRGARSAVSDEAAAASKAPTESGIKGPAEPANAPASEENAPPIKAPGAAETGIKPAPAAVEAQPTVSELGGERPANDLQTQIEQAHNAGDNAKVDQLITQLPPEMQAPMRSALGRPEPAAAAEPAPATPTLEKSGNDVQDLHSATGLVRNLLENGRDYSDVNGKNALQQILDLANSHLHSNDVVSSAINKRMAAALSDSEARNIRNAIETGNTAGLSDKEAAVVKSIQENIEAPSNATRTALSKDYQAAQNHFPQVRTTSVKDAIKGAAKAKGLNAKINTFEDLLNQNSRFSEGSTLGTFTRGKTTLTGDANDLGLVPKKNGTFVDKAGRVYNYSRATSQDLENAGAKIQAPKDALTAYVRDTLNLKTRADAADYVIKNANDLGLSETEAPGKAQVVNIKGSDGTEHSFFTDKKTAENIKGSGLIGNFTKEANLPVKAWNALSSMIAQGAVVNPFAHGLNLATNAAVGAGERANGITGVSTLLRSLKPIDEATELRMSDAGVHFPTYGKDTATAISKATGGLSKLNEKAVAAIDRQARAGMFENLTKGGMSDKEAANTINKWMGGRSTYRGDQANLGIFWRYFVRQNQNAGRLLTQAVKGHPGALINAAIAGGATFAADQGLKQVTGNQGAYMHAPGVVGIINDAGTSAEDLAKGQYRNAVNPVVNHINPLVSQVAEQVLGVNNYGDKFTSGQQRLQNLEGITPETNAVANNGHSLPEKVLNTFGVYTPHIKGAMATDNPTLAPVLNVKNAQNDSTVAFPTDFTGEQNAKAVNDYLGKTGTQYSSKTAATIASQTQDQQKAYTAATVALKKVGITSASDIHNFAQLSPSDQTDYIKAANSLNQAGTAISGTEMEKQLVKNGNIPLAASLNPNIPKSLSQQDKNTLETYSTLGADGQKNVWLQNNDNAYNYYTALVNQKQAQGALTTDDTDVGAAWSGSGNSLYVKALVAQTDKQNNVPQSLVELYKNTTKTEYEKMSGSQKDQLTAYAQQLNNNGVLDKFGLATGTSGGSSGKGASALDLAAGIPYGTVSGAFVKPTSNAGLQSVKAATYVQPKLLKFTPDEKANPFVRSISAVKGVK